MTKLSISQAWDETRAVLARDGKLIVPVALALLVLPGVVINLFLPSRSAGEVPTAGLWSVIVLVALVISFCGQLAVVRLAMSPHVTVAEAIRHAARRTLPFLGAFLLWIVPFVIVASFLYALLRANPAHPSGAVAVGLLLVICAGFFIFIRMFLIAPVASAETGGSIAILRRSWDLTAGNWWRLFGFFVVFAVGSLILVWAVGSVVGVISHLAFGALTPMSIGGLIVIIILQIVTAGVYVILFVMQARLYTQRLAEAQARVPTTGI